MSERPPPALDSSSFFSKLFFIWPATLIARRGALAEHDLNDLQLCDQSEYLANRFARFMNEECLRNPKSPSVGRVIFKSLRGPILRSASLVFLEIGAKIAEAVLLGYIIQYFRQSTPVSSGIGYAYAAGLVLATLLHTVLHHHFFFMSTRIGIQVRTMLIAAIYRKSMAFSASSSASAGVVVNLVSNDVATFEPLCLFGNFVWSGILEIFICTGLLWTYLGWPIFVGLAIFLLLIPSQGLFSNLFSRFRTKTVTWRDNRIRLMSDLLVGINVVKFSAWENPFSEEISRIRDKELRALIKSSSMEALNEGLATFGTVWLRGQPLLPENVFPSLALFSIMRLTMANFFPKAVKAFSESLVSSRRIGDFFIQPELGANRRIDNHQPTDELNDSDYIMRFDTATFSWKSNSNNKDPSTTVVNTIDDNISLTRMNTDEDLHKNILHNISLSIPRGTLIAIIGPVGAGKSSLLHAILGEMEEVTGTTIIHRSRNTSQQFISYSSQSSWILAGSVRDNIVFGALLNEQWLREVVQCCELEQDLEEWEHGMETIVGERGVMLSGGQRARISLARAIYAKPLLLLLDDPLSAVDTRVARRVFNTLRSHPELQNCTRILVTHQLQFVRECDQVVILEQGKVIDTGTWNNVLSRSTSGWREVLREYDGTLEEIDIDAMEVNNLQSNQQNSGNIFGPQKLQLKNDDGTSNISSISIHTVGPQEVDLHDDALMNSDSPAINDETHQIGQIRLRTYLDFLVAPTPTALVIFTTLLLIGTQSLAVYIDWHLTTWVTRPRDEQKNLTYYPLAYLIFVCVSIILGVMRAMLMFWILLRASGTLSKKMLYSVLRAPITWFVSQPTGRILNRFSKDQSQVDELLPAIFFDTIECALIVLGIVIVTIVVIPWVALSIPILGIAFYLMRYYYIQASREIKRFEAITRSPIYSQLSESLEGLPVIRAFGVQERFATRFMAAQNCNTRAVFAFNGCARWLGIRLDLLSTAFLAIAVFAAVIIGTSNRTQAGLIGLALSYVLQLNGLMQWMVRQSVECEIMFVAVERMLEYSNLPSEPPEHIDPPPPSGWPSAGEILIKDMSLTYPGSTVPVLKNWNICFSGGSKIGIVGRTGAGKSSFFLVLFRMYDFEGCISLDGIDTKTLGVKDLRSNISIIPQEPFLFKGTLRFNLDPFDTFSDQELWRCLDAVELKPTVERLEGKLSAEVTDNGKNFSIGERQLLCLARAILKKSKVIVLDEATANVDYHTDKLIQVSLRTQFRDSLVLTIAHRLSTVFTDYDKILVLSAGEIAQYGHAHELLQDRQGILSRMVDDTGEEASQGLRELALQSWMSKNCPNTN